MRIAVAVVVGVAVLGSVSAVCAAEPRRQRSEYCLDGCDLAFERCQARTSAKANSRCDIEAVKCKNDCPFETIEEPAVPTAQSHQRCVDACRDTYKKCLGRAENKRDGNCAADDVRCEQACPKPPPEVAAVPAGAPAAGGTSTTTGAPAAASAPSAPSTGDRVAPPREPIVPERAAAAPPPAAVPERATPPAARSEALAPPAESAAAARPAPQERGFFAKIGCFFYACEKASATTPCLDGCVTAYDECRAKESKRGGECNTRLMKCRQSCRDTAPAGR
jgi:hypothetical protein